MADPATASALLDGICGPDWSIAPEQVAEALILARDAARSGRRRDLHRLAGILMAAAAMAPDDDEETRLAGESIALLDRLADGCDVLAGLLNTVAEVVSPEAMQHAARIR